MHEGRPGARSGSPWIPLDPERPNTIGRDAGSRVRVPNRAISKVHAVIAWDGSTWVVSAQGKNGTALNGEPLHPTARRKLSEGDEIELARLTTFRFHLDARTRTAYLEQDPSAASTSTLLLSEVPKLMRLSSEGAGDAILEVDVRAGCAYLEEAGGRARIPLRPAEWAILVVLASRHGRTVDRQTLQEMTSDMESSDRASDSVYRHVSRLKAKLGPFAAALAVVHGLGYVFDAGPVPERGPARQ
ncbi:MAG: FHA domain-containing protein [Acidobacteriota bacterium]